MILKYVLEVFHQFIVTHHLIKYENFMLVRSNPLKRLKSDDVISEQPPQTCWWGQVQLLHLGNQQQPWQDLGLGESRSRRQKTVSRPSAELDDLWQESRLECGHELQHQLCEHKFCFISVHWWCSLYIDDDWNCKKNICQKCEICIEFHDLDDWPKHKL